jgi:hypothetical protein
MEIEKTYRQTGAWDVTVIGKEEMDQFFADRQFERKFFSGIVLYSCSVFMRRL